MTSLKKSAYEFIQKKLVAAEASSGIVLSDRTLAKELGMSRTPVREAIRQLESDGLVMQIPRIGTVIRIPNRAEMEELYDLRLILETYAVGRAAVCINESQLQQLDSVLDKMVVIGKKAKRDPQGFAGPVGREWMQTDAELHSLVLGFANALRTLKIVENMRIAVRTVGPAYVGPEKTAFHRNAKSHREHRLIVRALRQHDPEAARVAMSRHIATAKRIRMEGIDSLHETASSHPDWGETAWRIFRDASM
ncbi:MAG: GntR family transcriptional regulator [Phycisphaerae bacterium]